MTYRPRPEPIAVHHRRLARVAEQGDTFRAFFEHNPHAMWVFHIDTLSVIAVNDAAVEQYGYSREEFLAMTLADIRRPEDVPALVESMRDKPSLVPSTRRMRHRRRDGTLIDVDVAWVPIDIEGRACGVAMIHDVTERTRADGALRESEARYRLLAENANDMISRHARDGTYLYASPASKWLLGYEPEELIGRRAQDFIHPEDVVRLGQIDIGSLPDVYVESFRMFRKDRSIIWVEASTRHLKDPETGRVIETHAATRDVTERRAAEFALRESETRLQMLVGQMPAIVWTIDQELRFTTCMGAALAQMGIDPSTAAGKTLAQYFGAGDEGFALVDQHRRAIVGEPATYDVLWHGHSFHVHVEPLRRPDGTIAGAIGVALDVTEREEAQDALRKSRTSLASAQSIARLGNWDFNLSTGELIWSDELFRIYGLDPAATKPSPGAFWNYDHPDDAETVRRIIEQAEVERQPYDVTHRIVRPDGAVRWVQERGEFTFGPSGHPVRMVGTVHDITERREAEQRLAYLAHHDALTNLPNRTLLTDRLTQAVAHARRLDQLVAVMFIDLDRFKNINDTLGHGVGDQLLEAVAKRVADSTREGDTVSRPGGDEFIAVLTDIRHVDDVAKVAQKIVRAIAQPYQVDGRELFATASIGISMFPFDGGDVDSLIKNADRAMYQAKETGRNNFQFYTADMHASALERLALENDLRKALDRGEFVLFYQPLLDIATTAIIGSEALVRWRHPTLGLLPPDDFISLAEETGLIVPIGEWVVRTACAQTKAWINAGYPLRSTVNISARQFQQQDLLRVVEQALAESGLDPGLLELEITESVVMKDAEATIGILRGLKDAGVRLSVDDFGTGYSSLGYLKRFPIDTLKIDRSFVRDILVDKFDEAIARAVITLAHSLNLRVIAEGVETEAQLAFLRRLGCDEMQGNYASPALPPHVFARFLEERYNKI